MSLEEKRQFISMPMEERRKILAKQALQLIGDYPGYGQESTAAFVEDDNEIDIYDDVEYHFPGGAGIITHKCCDCGLVHDIEVHPHQFGGFHLVFHRK